MPTWVFALLWVLAFANYYCYYYFFILCVCSREEKMKEGLLAAISIPLKLASKANSLWPALRELAGIANIACKSDLQVWKSRVVYEYKQYRVGLLDGCIVWNAHNTVFSRKRSVVCAQAVYFLHSKRPSVTWLNNQWWLTACDWVMLVLSALLSTRVGRCKKLGSFLVQSAHAWGMT